jgi:hypothetical protein
MSKLKVQMKFKDQMTKSIKEKVLVIESFGIHLTFACLREAPPCRAKAGTLNFGFD